MALFFEYATHLNDFVKVQSYIPKQPGEISFIFKAYQL